MLMLECQGETEVISIVSKQSCFIYPWLAATTKIHAFTYRQWSEFYPGLFVQAGMNDAKESIARSKYNCLIF